MYKMYDALIMKVISIKSFLKESYTSFVFDLKFDNFFSYTTKFRN